MGSETDRDRAGIVLPAALIAVSVAARLVSLHALHPLNWDELEFFRATDWVRQGLVPYRDFFEHHTPLQWFLFAPVAALIRSSGAAAIVAMRWAQVPLWVATFWLLERWMRDAALSRFSRVCALAVPLTSTFFMLPAVEYRVDVLAIALMIAGLVLLQRMRAGIGYALAAGAAFALAGFANLRLAPALVLIMLLARIVRLPEQRWGGESRANWLFAGAAVTTALALLYFVSTHSLALAVRRVLRDNYVADHLQREIPWMFVHRLVAPFGLRIIRPPSDALFAWSAVDLGGLALVVVGTVGLVRALATRARKPDALFFIAFAQAANVLFIAAMKFIFNYHLEGVAVLAVPLIAAEIERLSARRAVVAALILTTALNASVALFRGKEDDLRYQDFIMREVDRRTPSGSAVFDSAGWALRRDPAYRYWFLRNIVLILEARGEYETYTAEAMLGAPPAAIIADHDTRLWMLRHPALGRVAIRHYLPLWRDLWLPGLSAVVTPGEAAAEWIVPADGVYRLTASPALANHQWFRQPFEITRPFSTPGVETSPELTWSIDGRPVPAATSFAFRKGSRVIARSGAAAPIGIMLVRGDPAELFQQPPAGVTLEASWSPRWHIPRF